MFCPQGAGRSPHQTGINCCSRGGKRHPNRTKRLHPDTLLNPLRPIRWLVMAIGETAYVNSVREQLLAGRARLSEVMGANESERVLQLLEEVDSALHRIDHGTFGVCEACLGTVEEERLRENPLARVCLDCLTPKQQRALEYDLELAAQIQKGLLPCNLGFHGWDVDFYYQPAGIVGGDYCDVIRENGHLYFI